MNPNADDVVVLPNRCLCCGVARWRQFRVSNYEPKSAKVQPKSSGGEHVESKKCVLGLSSAMMDCVDFAKVTAISNLICTVSCAGSTTPRSRWQTLASCGSRMNLLFWEFGSRCGEPGRNKTVSSPKSVRVIYGSTSSS